MTNQPSEQPKSRRFWGGKKTQPKDELPRRGFWRGNVEAFTVAIVMALVIKTHAFEAFQVPTESMEPTIIGRKSGGDRIIVNKFKYQFDDPERYQVVVFRYPLSRMVNYVKRLVGLPREQVMIAHGDIFVAPEDSQDFAIARKPIHLVDTLFEENPVIPTANAKTIDARSFRRWWDTDLDGFSFDASDETVTIDAGNGPRKATSKNPITPNRQDDYASDRKSRGDDLELPVGDIRIDLTITPSSGAGTVFLVIRDGTMPSQPMRLDLAVAGSDAASTLLLGREDVTPTSLRDFRLKAGEEARIQFENCDDRMRVLVDGEELARHEYVQSTRTGPESESQVQFGISSGKAVVSAVRVYRDLYYTLYDRNLNVFRVPADHYLFFGDNSANSLDARGWRVVGIRLREDGRVLLGDMEAVSDDFKYPRRPNNPYFDVVTETRGEDEIPVAIDDEDTHHFLDIHGNTWDLAPRSYDVLDLTRFDKPGPEILKLHGELLTDPQEAQVGIAEVSTSQLKELTDPFHNKQHAFRQFSRLMHFVHRDDIMGQANMVFWPATRWGVIR